MVAAMPQRPCPACAATSPRIAGSMTAAQVVAGNDTYADDALELLGIRGEERYHFAACERCGFLYALDLPDEPFLHQLYARVIRGDRARVESQSPSWVSHQLALAARLLSRLGTSVTVLDYGCGYGTIVRALQSPSIQCVGFEPSPTVLAALQQEGLDATGDLAAITARAPFDGIVLSDVLEHVPEPREVLSFCAGLLRPEGWLIVSVPDFGLRRRAAILRDLGRGRPVTRELNPWEHLNYFTPDALAAMLRAAGLDMAAEPLPAFGFRAETSGPRRVLNAGRSALRLLRFAASPGPSSTTLLAQRPAASSGTSRYNG
jgi:2-polyprenyl-3-methyl-5-hydroxy-6-metoxy-1,4-benzoquinol methylase